MALTKVSTDGVKDDAITKSKIPANQIEASELADNAVDTNAIADQAVALSKLPHGTSSNNGKFLQANNGADPTFETVNTDLVSDTSPQLGGDLSSNGNNITLGDNDQLRFGNATGGDIVIKHTTSDNDGHIENHTGDLFISTKGAGDDVIIQAVDDILLQPQGGEAGIKVIGDGAVELYHDDSLKVQTRSNGLEVHGKLVLGNNDIPSGQISNYSLDVQGDGTNAYIDMGNVFPTFSAGQFPTARFKTVEANKTLEIQSMWGGDNVLYKHIELAADKTKFFIGTSNNVEIAHFGTFGLTFNGDTAAANSLDDYEEGTFTLSFPGGVNITNNEMAYTKIGRFVFCSGRLTFASSGSNTIINMDGLPFTPNSSLGNSAMGGVVPEHTRGSDGPFFMAVESSSNKVRIRNGASQNQSISNMSGQSIRFQLTYMAA